MHNLPSLPSVVRTLLPYENSRLLAKHPWLPDTPAQCPTCSGAKTFRWWDDVRSADRKPVDYECPCIDQYMLQRYMLNSGIVQLWTRSIWADATGVAKPAAAWIGEYNSNLDYYIGRGTGLFMHGDSGNGKTLLAALTAKRALKMGFDVYYIQFAQLIDDYTRGWRNDLDRDWFESTMQGAQLLVIDDMAKEWVKRSEMVQPLVDAVFRARVQNQLATIITTNCDPQEFQEKYGRAVTELVIEGCQHFGFSGESWRVDHLQNRQNLEAQLRLTRPLSFG